VLIAWSAKSICKLTIKIKSRVITVQVMKAYSGNGVIVKPILNFDTRWRLGLPQAPVSLPTRKAPHIASWLGSWVGPRAKMDSLKQANNFAPACIQTVNLPSLILGTILTAVVSDRNSSTRVLYVCLYSKYFRDWVHSRYHPPTYSQIVLLPTPHTPTQLYSSRPDKHLQEI